MEFLEELNKKFKYQYDRDQYGHRFHTFSFSEAIEQNLLTDYRVVVVGVEDNEVKVFGATIF